MSKIKDYRTNQKVVATIKLQDKGQDFTELDLLENGVILGYSPMFEKGRMTCIGIGDPNGINCCYPTNILINSEWEAKDIMPPHENLLSCFYDTSDTELYVYVYPTDGIVEKPWEAGKLNYKILDISFEPENPDRFMEN